MEPTKAIEILERQRERGRKLIPMRLEYSQFKKWYRDTEVAIKKIFGVDSNHTKDFSSIKYSPVVYTSNTTDYELQQYYVQGLKNADSILESMIEEIRDFGSANQGLCGAKEVVNSNKALSRWSVGTRKAKVSHPASRLG